MFQENLPPQKSLESVSVPTASLGLQHLLLGLLQYFLTFDLSLFSLICRNGYFKKPDLFSSFAYDVALYKYSFQYKGINVSPWPISSFLLANQTYSCCFPNVYTPACILWLSDVYSNMCLYYFPIILPSAFERLPQPHSSSKSEGPLLPMFWQPSSTCYRITFKCLFSEYKHIFWGGTTSGRTHSTSPFKDCPVLYPFPLLCEHQIVAFFWDCPLICSVIYLFTLFLTWICQCFLLISQKLGRREVSFRRSSHISHRYPDLVDQGHSGLSKRWRPWSARLSHPYRMVSWIQGTWCVSRYVCLIVGQQNCLSLNKTFCDFHVSPYN